MMCRLRDMYTNLRKSCLNLIFHLAWRRMRAKAENA